MAARIFDPFLAFFITMWVISRAAEDSEAVTAKPGDDVILHCQGQRYAPIHLIVWSRTDLESDDYVFFFRHGHSYGPYQHPSFRGRVVLRDPEVKYGDASVILKNINVNDAGIYECRIRERYAPELTNTVRLTVKGHTAGDDGEFDAWEIGLTVAGGLSVIVVVVICLLICKCTIDRKRRGHSSNQPLADGEIPMHNLD
ncbi:nectin-4-like [Micropterus dolomieu]|uniref:nectin-4-like n=1 Tax=Micropterus dolomieu TaxID=147949 RepID=UPI001E8EBDA2|nr:nectin-4-like [Micropterus dolomieu]